MVPPLVSIVIVNFNGGEVIIDCLKSIFLHCSTVPFEVIVVDNASTDQSPDRITQAFPPVLLLPQSSNLGFGTANNVGVGHAQGEYLFLLNSDVVLTADILPPLLAKLNQDPRIGIVGPRLLNPDGSFQLSVSREIGLLGEFLTLQQVWRYRNPASRDALAQIYDHDQAVEIVVGAAMVMRRSLFNQVGGFDENFFMYFEESDLCKRIRDLGHTILYTPEVSVVHLGGYSVAQSAGPMAQEYRRSQRYYYQKHRPLWEQWVLHLYLGYKRWRQTLRK
jgi:hypothetical protein